MTTILTHKQMVDQTVQIAKDACAEVGCDYNEFIAALTVALNKGA
jgi:hypothetical protein